MNVKINSVHEIRSVPTRKVAIAVIVNLTPLEIQLFEDVCICIYSQLFECTILE